ncbi:hypothetical protein DDZ13_08890 [Coraliomargarita sinensis]|uniref:Uncharacterized protein n=1 Tax=Coraliomargarita sinensis TaxID=2174842 RepID=A0A317ZF53_9BACT|nr:hypothetical protein [Coraliomargarita sinensis]PXA04145.1 hypothetical protein DDZ13_08890 [Coraliomargarita sinensis]
MTNDQRKRLKTQLVAGRALMEAMKQSVILTGIQITDVWRFSSYKIYMQRYNSLVDHVLRDCHIDVPCGKWDLEKVPDGNSTIANTQKNYFDSVFANLSMLVAFLEEYLDTKHDERTALRDFFQANLRRSIFSIPSKEMEVQDAVESLLIGKGLQKPTDYDREKGRVKVSIKETIPDFILPKLNLAIEVKLSKTKTKSKEIVDEINADIQAYGKAYATIIFIIYDLGTIQDEAEFRSGLETSNGDIQLVIVKQ